MKRTAFLLGSALSLAGGLMLPSTGPVQAQASACSAEIMYVQQELRSTPITANRSYIKSGATPRTNSADRGATALATTSPTRLGTRLGESLGEGPGAGPGGYRQTAHAVPSGSGEARGPGALPDAPGLRRYNVPVPAQTEPMDADRIQSGGALRRGTNPDEAAEALARARAFDQAGDDRACMNAVKEAKRYLR
jgi:hypothetical protein